jgi:hypothetical protein
LQVGQNYFAHDAVQAVFNRALKSVCGDE